MTTYRNFSNTAATTQLNGGISNSDTSLAVDDASGYPAVPFTIRIDSEVIHVGGKSGTTFSSLTRGYDGTSAVSHSDNAQVRHVVAAKDVGEQHSLTAVDTNLELRAENSGSGSQDIDMYADDSGGTARRRFFIDGDGDIYAYDDGGNQILRLAETDGELIWNPVATSPHIIVAGDLYPGFIIADNSGNRQWVVEQANGAQEWYVITYDSSGASAQTPVHYFHNTDSTYNEDVVRYDADVLLGRNGTQTQPSLSIGSKTTGLFYTTNTLNATADSKGGEIYPKPYIDAGKAESGTDITNVSSTYGELSATVQTIACEYANQPIMVQMSCRVEWVNLTAGQSVQLGPSVNGSQSGLGGARTDNFGTTSSSGDGVDVSGSSSSGGDNVDIDGNTGGATAGTAHIHSADGSLKVNGTHTHGSGSYSVNGNHTHTLDMDSFTQTRTLMGFETTADGSGNVTVGIAGAGNNSADITGWHISWTIWRR